MADQVAPPDLGAVVRELCDGALPYLGGGIGKVVFGSPRWVVKRQRSFRESVAVVLATDLIGWIRAHLPRGCRRWFVPRLVLDPTSATSRLRDLARRLLELLLLATLTLVPRGHWERTGVAQRARSHALRAERGEVLAARHLEGTGLVPRRVPLPPTSVMTGRCRRRLVITAAFERAERTLGEELRLLAASDRQAELLVWLDRLIALQGELGRRGLCDVTNNPFGNHAIIGTRLVLIDNGGLTDAPSEIRSVLEVDWARWIGHIRELLDLLLPAGVATAFTGRLEVVLRTASAGADPPSQDGLVGRAVAALAPPGLGATT